MTIKKGIKNLLATGLVLVLAGSLFFGWAWSEARQAQGCDRFVIDSYEVHIGVDIPAVSSWNCHLDGEGRRIAVYTLDTDLDHYIRKARLRPTMEPLKQLLFAFSLLNLDEQEGSSQLYSTSGVSGTGMPWNMVLDKATGRLWVEIQFAATPNHETQT